MSKVSKRIVNSSKKIEKVKIYGERNSGTNFISKLIKNNFKNIEFCKQTYNGGTGWKHGIPKLELFENTLDNTLFIFIIRDLEPWLKSFYNTPYSMKKKNSIKAFLQEKLEADDDRKKHDVNIYDCEKNKTVFELRYTKIRSYIETFEKVKNGIIVNLENLQKDNGEKFIKCLFHNFKLKRSSLNFKPVIKHTKSKVDGMKNRTYDIVLDKDILKKSTDEGMEIFVKDLKRGFLIKKRITT